MSDSEEWNLINEIRITQIFFLVMKALSFAQQDKNQLMEKLNNSQRELANASMEMDRLKREAFTKAEQDKVIINKNDH